MDPRLLQYYGQELSYIRELGGEFAREFPKIAGRLGLETFECSDPYVERLLEGFAFLAARVHLKIDDEFPRFTQHLLEILYPHYLAPIPSMGIMQLSPNLNESVLAQGYRVPRGSSLRSVLGRGDQTACEYRTAHDVTLWPLEIAAAEYTGYVGDLGDLALRGRPRAVLRLKLRATAGLKISELSLDELTLFLRGGDELPGAALRAAALRPLSGGRWCVPPPGRSRGSTSRSTRRWRPRGSRTTRSAAPLSDRVRFRGIACSRSTSAFPARFLFVKLQDLRAGMSRCDGARGRDHCSSPTRTAGQPGRRGQCAALRAPLHAGREWMFPAAPTASI